MENARRPGDFPADRYFAEHERKIRDMIDHAIQATKSLIAPPIFERLQTKWAANAQGLRRFLDAVKEREDPKAFRRLFILRELLRGEFAEPSHIYARATKRLICPGVVRKWTRQIRLKTALVPL